MLAFILFLAIVFGAIWAYNKLFGGCNCNKATTP